MKLPIPFTIHDLRFTFRKKSDGAVSPSTAGAHGVTCPAASNRQSSIVNRQSSKGVALVITLILLSVTLIMAIAFLSVAQRERNAVNTAADTTTARLAADTALAAAQAQIAANALSGGPGAYNYGLLVSTNYLTPGGIVPGTASIGTLSYYDPSGNLLTGDFLSQVVSNLYYLPRAPVFVNNPNNGQNDFRYYLDLNRNGQFDTNGQVAEFDSTGTPTGNTVFEVGDPEWVGILEHPDQPHGPNNKFIARYAFIAQPAGNTLDLNAIHNQTQSASTANQFTPTADGYFRNEGVGSWELNLAAFLTDLNTNLWDPLVNYYIYQQPSIANMGAAFEDAQSLLAWRYANYYPSLTFAPLNVQAVAVSGQIDAYTIGNLMTSTLLPVALVPAALNWAGSDNPNRFFSLVSDAYDLSKTTVGVSPANVASGNYFTGRLLTAGNSPATYDRYTFYRLLNEMGTDSAPDDNRMNLNYDNLDAIGNVIPGAETNAISWTPIRFFTFAADRLLKHYTTNWITANFPFYTNTFGVTTVHPFGVTNIPVYINGQFVYTPAVNRLLQLTANLYDATTNSPYPSVFRPMFSVVKTNGFQNIYIDGYREVSALPTFTVGTAPLDLPLDISGTGLATDAAVDDPNGNLYGVPWIVGAKKGLPSFNEAYSRNSLQVTRKLEVTRNNPYIPGADATNEMFIMSITNQMGFGFWNSYNNNYPRPVTVFLNDILLMTLTNGANTWVAYTNIGFNVTQAAWPGSAWTFSGQTAPEFQSPTNSAAFITATYDIPVLPESQYSFFQTKFIPSAFAQWEPNLPGPPVFPQFGLTTTNWLQAYIIDGSHIIDYVQLRGPVSTTNLNAELQDPNDGINALHYYQWSTNAFGFNNPNNTPTYGVVNQISVSRKGISTVAGKWSNPGGMPAGVPQIPAAEAAYFNGFFTPTWTFGGKTYVNTNGALWPVQAPFTPTRTIWQFTLWQANDPLVHYLASDLNTYTRDTVPGYSDDLITKKLPTITLNSLADHYQPWGRNTAMAYLNGVDSNPFNLADRDPLLWGSDFWDFPAGKYPTVGWLGRVHRGTPWQTVYLKATDTLQDVVSGYQGLPQFVGTNTWAQWTGDTQFAYNPQTGLYENFDAVNSAPVQDGDLFDLFSTSLNGNATRGTLSVNQPGLAAWSAVFSGLVALTNITANPASYNAPVYTNLIISPAGPAGNNSALGQIVNGPNGINATRAYFTNADGVGGAFEHVGDILRVPALAEQSPFLHTDTANQNYDLNDEVYEWLPQQTLGLLRAGSSPRYVAYCYGQTLRPAVGGEVLNGPAFGLYTNYQITAETAARVIFRLVPHVTPTGTNYQSVIESFTPLPPN